MPSPMTLPAGVVGTYCLAMLTGKFATELIAVAVIRSIAPGPRRNRLTMWCDWSKRTADSRQARCSRRQLENSDGTTGYTYAPSCELRSRSTVFGVASRTSCRFFAAIVGSPLGGDYVSRYRYGRTMSPSVMNLRFAILATLSAGPRTGYDLTRRFDSTVGHIWHAPHSQIYPELRRMEQAGLVAADEVPRGPRGTK